MPAPSVPYKVMAEGLEFDAGAADGSGGGRGLRASIPFLLEWAHFFTFANEVMGTQTGAGFPIGWVLPWQLPSSPNLYAASCRGRPCGSNGQPEAAMKGMAPGEFFTHILATVEFCVPPYTQQPGDDPSNANQIDPFNPITLCTHQIRVNGQVVTRKGAGYEFDDGTQIPADLGVLETRTELILTFPKVPFIPWRQIRPYVGTVNDVGFLDCPRGNLLFLGFDDDHNQTTFGTQGQRVSLKWAVGHEDRDWNEKEGRDGVFQLVRRKGDTAKRIYAYTDHRLIVSP